MVVSYLTNDIGRAIRGGTGMHENICGDRDRSTDFKEFESGFEPYRRISAEHSLKPQPNYGNIARKIYNARRERDTVFKGDLFSDPAWDILLDLYTSEKSGQKISVTSACIAARVPTSTGLRWITILIQNGYVERQSDPSDARRSFLSLTPAAREGMEILFEQLQSQDR